MAWCSHFRIVFTVVCWVVDPQIHIAGWRGYKLNGRAITRTGIRWKSPCWYLCKLDTRLNTCSNG